MPSKFKFIHTADIHLGSLLNVSGDLPENINKLCKSAVYDAFERICDAAIKYKVSFILICGDLYDMDSPSVKANKFFIEQCEKLEHENIKVYVIAGNHDPISSRKELFKLPHNTYVLSENNVEEIECFEEDNLIARIIGQSYKYKSLEGRVLSDYKVENKDVFNIGMLHTSLENTDNNYMPCSINELRNNENFHYWALGHVHKRQIFHEGKLIAAFPGIPQGRDMGEKEASGCLLIEVNNNEIEKYSVIPTASVIYKEIEVHINNHKHNQPESIGELENIILEMGENILDGFHNIDNNSDNIRSQHEDYFKGYIVRWVVKGRGRLHNIVKDMSEDDCNVIINNMNKYFTSKPNFLWTDSIIFRTAAENPDLKELFSKNKTFIELSDVLNDLKEDEEIKNQVLEDWGKIWEVNNRREEINLEKFQVDDEVFEDIIEQASNLVIEKLIDSYE
jgi:DNA repair exonuclease SbcCD nuclease subunit